MGAFIGCGDWCTRTLSVWLQLTWGWECRWELAASRLCRRRAAVRRCHTVHHITQSRSLSTTTACCATQQRVSYPSCRKFPVSSGVSSHRQPRQCRGGAGAQNGKGAQSDPNYVSRLLLDCVPVFHNIITPAYLLYLSGPVAIYAYYSEIFSLILWFRSYSDVIIDGIARSECLPGGAKNYSYATAGEFR